MRLKIIKNEQDHAQALERLDALMDIDPAEGSPEADELDVLVLLIERYEATHFPVEMPSPVDAILFRMEQQGLKNKDLIPFIGHASKVSEVLSGKRPLSLTMIRKLSEGLGIPSDILIQDPARQGQFEQDENWQAFPLSDMRKRGYFPDFNGTLNELKEYAAEWVGTFLAQVNLTTKTQPMMMRTSAHLRNNNKESDPYAMRAWQARVLHLAQCQPRLPTYSPGTVTESWMRELVKLSWSQQGPALAVEYLNRAGIQVVFEPHLPKTYLDGAVCLSESKHPIIALTLRYDRLDNFWFTLLHELSHIALHVDGNECWYLDDLDAASDDPKENEADALAQDVLIPSTAIPDGLPKDPQAIEELAHTLSISPCIIAGRIRREEHNYQLFGKAFRSDKLVRKTLAAAGYITA